MFKPGKEVIVNHASVTGHTQLDGGLVAD